VADVKAVEHPDRDTDRVLDGLPTFQEIGPGNDSHLVPSEGNVAA
jgi:hypothetical protein